MAFWTRLRQWLPPWPRCCRSACLPVPPAALWHRRAPWGGLFRDGAGQGRTEPCFRTAVPLPKPRPAEAPAIEPEPPAAASSRPASHRPTAEPSRRPHRATTALGLPAGADRGDRDRPQHSRYPRPRRLRRRGSGTAGGGGAAGQATGRGQAGRDAPLRHGLGDRGLGPHRHRAADHEPRQHHQRARQFRLVRMPRPQPRRRRAIVRAWPRQCARRSRLQARQRPVDLADRPHGAARGPRERAAFGLRALHHRAGAGLGRLPRGPHPSRSDGAAQQLQNLPVERVGSAAADRADAAGRAAGGSAAARGGQIRYNPSGSRRRKPDAEPDADARRQQKSAGKTGAFESSIVACSLTARSRCRRPAAPSANYTASRHDAARAPRRRCRP